MCCADTACYVELFSYYVFPYFVHGVHVRLALCNSGNVCDTAVHVCCANSVADGFVLINDLYVSLAVFAIAGALCVEEELSQIEILFFARCTVETYEAHFDDLMAWSVFVFARAESITKQVGIFDSNIKQGAFAGCLIMSNGCFVEVTHVVKLMTQLFNILPAFFTCPAVRFFGADGSCCIKVAVWFLG